ncbi:MAG: hypothetical protein COU65_02105 [Candidatus Pacebacteria bacterium CG10_big_fil_rev_8_21_14_0_10_42_12]|nr:glycosyltransferase family 2 protein [Candidatus Paceibacterota bacterium]PIR62693.1 MAG: hypothetical protein COU65_02105 [Candidatus Pacebacteria bacterium CG10_big_fil_rev_8_21_14_0_10_42_12]
MPKTKPTFSIVIPALNEAKYLPHLLDDLAKQSAKDFEVIVVDGSSDDKTVHKAKKFSDVLNLRIRVVKKRNVAHQRNVGGKMAKADWIIFMDADNRLPVSFLDGIRYQLAKNPETDIFTLWVKVDSKDRLDKTIEQLINVGMEVFSKIGKDSAVGALIGCKKSLFDSVTFDQKIKFIEDGKFVQDACKAGYTFSIFRDPWYFYSLRRMKTTGTLKTMRTIAPLQLQFLRGKDIYKAESYPMEGGSYYDQFPEQERSILRNMSTFIKTATTQQRLDVTKLVKRFFDTED